MLYLCILLFNVMIINSEPYNTPILISNNDYFYSDYGSGSISGSSSGFNPDSNKSIIIHLDEPNKETELRSKVIYGVSILLFSVSVFFILYGLYTPQYKKKNETIETHSFSNPLFNFDDLDDNDDDEPLYEPNVGIPKYAMYNDNIDYDYSDSEI